MQAGDSGMHAHTDQPSICLTTQRRASRGTFGCSAHASHASNIEPQRCWHDTPDKQLLSSYASGSSSASARDTPVVPSGLPVAPAGPWAAGIAHVQSSGNHLLQLELAEQKSADVHEWQHVAIDLWHEGNGHGEGWQVGAR